MAIARLASCWKRHLWIHSKAVRDRAILATLLYHGIRREELCRLDVKDLHSRQGVMYFRVKGKRSKIRFVEVNPAALRTIEAYLALAVKPLCGINPRKSPAKRNPVICRPPKDHIVPLACGGPDAVANLRWQTVAAAKAKDRQERWGCHR